MTTGDKRNEALGIGPFRPPPGLDESGHVPHLEQPSAFLDAVATPSEMDHS